MLQQQAMMVSFLSVAVEIPLTMGPFFKPLGLCANYQRPVLFLEVVTGVMATFQGNWSSGLGGSGIFRLPS